MPNYTIQLRRGTAAEHGSFTGAAGEVTVNTTRNSVHIHDGSTAGGTEMATKSSVDNLSSDTLIDADNNTHVKVEASSDVNEVQMTAAGNLVAKVTSAAILPGSNDTYNLGASGNEWNDVFVDNVKASTSITDGTLNIASGSITSGVAGTFSGQVQAGTLVGALTGASTGAHNGTVGASTPATIVGTTIGGTVITASTRFAGDVTGDVTGSIAGSTANMSGTVTGGTFTDGTMSINGGSLTSVVNLTTTGNMVVGGNFTVSGTTTTVNTETLTIDDNIIVLNNNEGGTPSQNAGIEVERGTATNKTFIWDEGSDNWTVGSETIVAGLFSGVASSAKYADLAERYHSGMSIEAGSVVCFGGEHEIEMCNEDTCTRVAGVISTAPAFMMNKDAGNDDTHPYVALSGRVPCKVQGPIMKGDLLVSSTDGHAKAGAFVGGAVIGKALENFDGESGVIEVLVNLM
jgi:hypothetical protein